MCFFLFLSIINSIIHNDLYIYYYYSILLGIKDSAWVEGNGGSSKFMRKMNPLAHKPLAQYRVLASVDLKQINAYDAIFTEETAFAIDFPSSPLLSQYFSSTDRVTKVSIMVSNA